MQPSGNSGVLLCDDLIFASRIAGTARALGLILQVARTSADLRAVIEKIAPRCVILDLHHPELKLGELLPWIRQTCVTMPRIVGYGSHVDAATLRGAREAGCDPVLPRSKFVEDLEKEMARWFEGV